MWSTFFRDGGFGMYPTVIFGFLLVASGVLYLMRPERRFVPALISLTVTTFASGLLGTAMGLITTFRYLQNLPPSEQVGIGALGCAESLNNLVLALILVTLTGLLVTISTVRSAWRSAETPAV